MRILLSVGLPAAGVVALCAGVVSSGLLAHVHVPIVKQHALLVAATILIGLLARAVFRVPAWLFAGALWLVAHVFFAGPASVLAALILACGALAIGSLLVRSQGPARAPLALCVGLVLLSALGGWLLPFPVHYRWSYLVVLVGFALWRRQVLLGMARESALAVWSSAQASPWLALVAMGVLGLASLGTWLPTMMYDDMAYHLGIPWQLRDLGYYRMDAASQIWALAPWAGDVLYAISDVLAGRESRGSVNLLWLLATAGLAGRLCGVLGGSVSASWWSIILFASLPMTVSLASGMQTEGPSAAVLLALALAIANLRQEDARHRLAAIAVLAAGLLAMKTSMVLALFPMGLWLLLRLRGRLPWTVLPACVLLGLWVCGSSYFYAWWFTGNPVMPLFNAVFQSPLYGAVNFRDPLYTGLWHPTLPWRFVFDSKRYMEGWPGAAGFLYVGLLGLVPLALWDRERRAVALVALASMVLTTIAVQYVRYLHPMLVLAIPALLAAFSRVSDRRWVGVVCAAPLLLNLAFFSHANWPIRSGAIQMLAESRGDPRVLFHAFLGERLVAREFRREHPDARVLFAGRASHAEWSGRAFSLSWYDTAMVRAWWGGRTWESPESFAHLLQTFGFTHVIIAGPPTWESMPAQLEALGATEGFGPGGVKVWTLPAEWAGDRDLRAERDRVRVERGP